MNNYFKMLSIAGIASLPQLASAAGPTLSDIFVNSGITAAGYADASYYAYFHKSNAGALGSGPQLHAFDNSSDNTFSVNQAALTLSSLPTSGFGALVNVIVGDDAKVINNAYGTGGRDFSLTQAYVQYAVGNLTVMGGRFVTLAGAEVIDDTKNTNVSRSLLFTNAEPLVHTGVRAAYKVNDMVTGTLGINNSVLGSAVDGDKHKTLETGLSLTPTSTISVALADYFGLDGNGAGTTKSNFFDLVASWQATSKLQFVLNGDYVRYYGSTVTVPGGTANPAGTTVADGQFTVSGLALYANYQVNDQWKTSVRVEDTYSKIKNSTGGHAGIHANEATATVDYSPTKYFDVLAEGRLDFAGALSGGGVETPLFAGSSSGRKSQPEILLKAIFKFGTPTGS